MTQPMSRRTILSASALSALGVMSAPSASAVTPKAATPRRVTIVACPHPDDEAVRLSTYCVRAAVRGDQMILAQVTDGSATYVGTKLGLTKSQTTQWRYREQRQYWEWVTNGTGEVRYLGLRDGSATPGEVYRGLSDILAALPSDVLPEVYVPTLPVDKRYSVSSDRHPDHLAVVDAAYRLHADGVIVRFARHVSVVGYRGGTHYNPTAAEALVAKNAINAYRPVGMVSTSNLVEAQKVGGKSVIIRP